MKSFDNRRVYITGGSSGIGLSTAKLLAEMGASIIIFSRNRKRLDAALKEIRDASNTDNQKFSSLQLDVSQRKDVEKTLTEAVKSFGPPDLLINCAGRAVPRYFEEIPFEQFDETMKINLYGVWNTVSVLLPYMKEKGGHISCVSSIAGFVGVFGYTDYSASKFALIGFFEALRSELKQFNITLSVLCPPDTRTPGFERENKTKPEETKAVSGGAKIMMPDDVAAAYLRGMMKDRFIIIPGFDGKFTFLAKRLFPGLVSLIMDRIIKKTEKKKNKD